MKLLYIGKYGDKSNIYIRFNSLDNLLEVKVMEAERKSKLKIIFEMVQKLNTKINADKICETWKESMKISTHNIVSDCVKFFNEIKNKKIEGEKISSFKKCAKLSHKINRNNTINKETKSVENLEFDDIEPLLNRYMSPPNNFTRSLRKSKPHTNSLEKITELSLRKEEDSSAFRIDENSNFNRDYGSDRIIPLSIKFKHSKIGLKK